MEVRQRGAKEQAHGSGFPGCPRDRGRYRETEAQTERQSLCLVCKSIPVIVDCVSSLNLFVI